MKSPPPSDMRGRGPGKMSVSEKVFAILEGNADSTGPVVVLFGWVGRYYLIHDCNFFGDCFNFFISIQYCHTYFSVISV